MKIAQKQSSKKQMQEYDALIVIASKWMIVWVKSSTDNFEDQFMVQVRNNGINMTH